MGKYDTTRDEDMAAMLDHATERVAALKTALSDVLVVVNTLREADGELPFGLRTLYPQAVAVLRGALCPKCDADPTVTPGLCECRAPSSERLIEARPVSASECRRLHARYDLDACDALMGIFGLARAEKEE